MKYFDILLSFLRSPRLINSNVILFSSVLIRSIAESTDDDQRKPEKLSLKKKGIGSEARAERVANADADLHLLNEAERGRLLQKQKKRRLQGREDEVCYNSLILVYHLLRRSWPILVSPHLSYLSLLHFLPSAIVLSYHYDWNILTLS